MVPTYEDIEQAIRGAVPEGWYVGNLAMDRRLDWPLNGRPQVSYTCEAMTGRFIGSRRGHDVGRRIAVRLSADSVEAMVAAVRDLPKLEFLFGHALGTEFDVDSNDD